MRSIYQPESFLTDISLVDEPDKYGETIAVVYEQQKELEMLFADCAQ